MEKTLRKWFPVFVLPTLVAFLIAFLIPFFMGMWLSFGEYTTIADVKMVGFDNYINAFKDLDFGESILRTIRFALISVVSINLIAFIFANLLTKKLKATNIFRTIFFMPNLIGGIVVGWLGQTVINELLIRFADKTLGFSPEIGLTALVVLINWQMIGYMMVIYIAGIQSVPDELIEAAKIDGASKWKTLWKVTIPMVMPSITICLFLTISNAFKLFDQNLALLGKEDPKRALVAMDIFTTIYSGSAKSLKGLGQAKAVIFFIIVAVITFTQLILTRRKEVES